MIEPLVSIIVPIYNVSEYIELSIETICCQKYKNIEIVLVDDESPDNSIDIAKSVVEKYGVNYKIINQKNKGLPGARNTGIRNCSGDYVCFIDSDDCISDTHIKALVECINKNVMVAFSGFESVRINNRKGNESNEYSISYFNKDVLFDFFLKRRPPIHCCSLLVNKSFMYEKNILFNEKLRYGEDVEFMWRLFSEIEYIGFTGNNTYKYLIRDNSIMTSLNLEIDKIFLEEFKLTIESLKVSFPTYKKIYDYVYARTLLGWLHSIARKSTYTEFTEAKYLICENEIFCLLKKFPDKRIIILSYLLKLVPKLFYEITKRN